MPKLLSVDTPGEAWRKATKLVITEGKLITDDKEILKECLHVIISIKNPLKNDKILKKFADEDLLEFMERNFLKCEAISGWGYSYGSRIFNFNGVNQVDEVVKKLSKKPESKSATIIFSDPTHDFQGHSPCVSLSDFKIRKQKLIITAFLRSQDIGRKIYADIIAISKISKIIADRLEIKLGSLTLVITSAHIYKKDWAKINNLISYGRKKRKNIFSSQS